MTITVTDIEAGPFVATGAAQTVSYTFMTLTDTEIDVFYDDGHGRVLIDPALHTVIPAKTMTGQRIEGGTVELVAGAAPVGSNIYLVAAPLNTRNIAWSNHGSLLANLNEEQDRDTLRWLVAKSIMDRAVLAAPGQPVPDPQSIIDAAAAIAAKADVDLANVDPDIAVAALGVAKVDLSNVSGDDFADKPHTVYSYGQATRTRSVVPKSISDRFAEYASTEDFGIRLHQSGNSGPLQDNTAALQEAVDKIQARDGCLWVSNFGARYGSTTVMTGPVTMRTGVHNGIDYTGKGFAIIGVEPGDRSAWAGGRYNAGQGFKLTSGSTNPLFTSPAGAGILVMENLLLSGNGNHARGLELSNASGSGAYGMGAHMKHVYINGFGRAGFHVGSGRGRGTTEWVWVEYCGGTSTEAAWAQLAYDWEHYSVGIGVNANTGLYVGNGSQVRFIGGASWMNDIGVQVDSSAMDVDFIGFHFDNANRTNLVVLGHENFGDRMGGRRFVSCRFSGASQAGNGLHPAIKLIDVQDGDTIFTAPDFAGGHGAEAALPSYLVEADANSIFRVDDFVYEANGSNKPYVTAPINNWNRIRMGGNTRTHIGISNNGDGLTATAGGVVSLEVRDKQVALGGTVGAAPFQAETVSGGVNNRIVAQSTSAGFNFAILRAVSASGTPVDLALQGTNGGMLRFGAHSAVASETVTGYITIRDDSGAVRKLAVIS